MADSSMSNPASISFPNINEWPQAAVQPILNCMVQWRVFGFPIVVKTLTGRFLDVYIDNGDTVRDLKEKISHECGILPDQQRLIYLGQQLNNDDTPIVATGIENESVVHIVLRLRGGAKTPSRQRPRHMKRICRSPYFLRGVLKIRQGEVVADLKKRIYRRWEFKKRFGNFDLEEFGLAPRKKGALRPLDVTDNEVLSDATVLASLGIKYILDLVLVLGMTPAAQSVTQALAPVPVKTVEIQRVLQRFSGNTNTMEGHQTTGR